MRKSKAKTYADYYRRVCHWASGLDKITCCWKANQETGVEFTTEERTLLDEASDLYRQAEEKFRTVWSKRIGDAQVSEIRSESYR